MLVIAPQARDYYEEVVAFAKSSNLYKVDPTPTRHQVWLTSTGEERTIVGVNEEMGVLEIEGAEGSCEVQYMIVNAAKTGRRPMLRDALDLGGGRVLAPSEEQAKASPVPIVEGGFARVVPVEISIGREIWAITAFLQKFQPNFTPDNVRHTLTWNLHFLDTYAEHSDRGKSRCTMYRDSAPHSFYFVMERRKGDGSYETWFSGGLIYYGAGDSGVGEPQLSVRIGSTSQAGWSINT